MELLDLSSASVRLMGLISEFLSKYILSGMYLTNLCQGQKLLEVGVLTVEQCSLLCFVLIHKS